MSNPELSTTARVKVVELGRQPAQGERPQSITVPDNLSGFVSGDAPGTFEMTSQKRAAILAIVREILPMLIKPDGRLKDNTTAGIDPYYPRNDDVRELMIDTRIPAFQFPIPGLRSSVRRTFSRPERQEDGRKSRALRGETLGELLVHAIVAEGQMVGFAGINRDGERIIDDVASTRYTRSLWKSTLYAQERASSLNRAEIIHDALQLEALGFSVDDVIKSILMAPVVVRYSNRRIKQHIRHKPFGRFSFITYPEVYPPLSVEEGTSAFIRHTESWSGVDLRRVTATAREITSRYLSDSTT